VNVNTGDPQMWGPECSFQAVEVPKLYIRAAVYCSAGTPTTAQLFWEKENGASAMSEAQSYSLTLINDGQYHLYTLDLSKNASWTGQISRLRFDPVYNGTTGDYVKVSAITSTAPGVAVTESGGATAVAEGGATDTYTVVLTGEPTANVTITPSPNSQLTVSPASLTFTTSNWNVPQTVTVTAVNDAVAESTHSGTITHAAASTDPGYSGIAIAAVTATITDDVSSFNEWTGGGVLMTPGLLTKYAVGGAPSPAGFSEQSAAGFSDANFALTAIVRTSDPLLTVIGQSSTDLITWTDLINNPSGTLSFSQAGAPSGCKRLDFTIPIDADSKKFLRLKIIAPSP
jgi:hypothetical protein